MQCSPKLLYPCLTLFVLCPTLIAQNLHSSIRQNIRRAAYIFAGTVTSVEHIDAGESAVGSVQITFHVDLAMRGVSTGQSLTIREWSGLWTGGDRYLPGQDVVLCLFKPSKLGLTSTVGTPPSRMEVHQGAVIPQPAWSVEPNQSLAPRSTMNGMSVRDFARPVARRAGE
jgi:hypothetical protein